MGHGAICTTMQSVGAELPLVSRRTELAVLTGHWADEDTVSVLTYRHFAVERGESVMQGLVALR